MNFFTDHELLEFSDQELKKLLKRMGITGWLQANKSGKIKQILQKQNEILSRTYA